jgi:hypothetical protein
MTALSPEDEMSSPDPAPRRMLDGGGGEPARSLVASARLDRVPSSAKARVAAALGGVLEPDAVRPGESVPSARSGALSRLATRFGLYVMGTGVVAGVALALWLRAAPGESSNASSTPPVVSAPPPKAAAQGAAPGAESATGGSRTEHEEPFAVTRQAEPTRAGEPTRRAAPTPQIEHAEHQVPSPVARATPQRSSPEGDGRQGDVLDSGLLAEVRAIEAVNAAISAGHARLAAREIEAYRRRFPRGELAIEADVLEVQIATLRGEHATARAAAKQLLARPEAQHYRARVGSLLEGEAERAEPTNHEKVERSRSNDAAPDMRARR